MDFDLERPQMKFYKAKFTELTRNLNRCWKKSDKFKPLTIRNNQYFCERDERQKVVSIKVTGKCFITVLGPRTRSDLAVYCIKVFDRRSKTKINEISNLIDKPEYLVFSPKYNILVAKAHETCPSMPDTLNIWSLESQHDSFLRAYHLKSSGLGARCTSLVLKEDVYFGSLRKDCVVMVPTRYNNKSVVRFLALSRVNFSPETFKGGVWRTDNTGERFVKTNNGLIYEGYKVAVEEVGRVHIGHLVQLGVADFTDKWAILFTEAPKELPDRNINLIVIDMSTMGIKHVIKVKLCSCHCLSHSCLAGLRAQDRGVRRQLAPAGARRGCGCRERRLPQGFRSGERKGTDEPEGSQAYGQNQHHHH